MSLQITKHEHSLATIVSDNYQTPDNAQVILDEWSLPISIHPDTPNIIDALPTYATANDLREFVKFLKRKPTGVTIIETMNAEPRRIFDARKIAAYEFWGIIQRDGDKLTLTSLGNEFAEKIDPEVTVYREIIAKFSPYLGFLKWTCIQNLNIVTHFDAIQFWQQNPRDVKIDQTKEKDSEAMAVTFFSLCHAAELGTLTVGKRGQPARFRIETDELESFLQISDSFSNQNRILIKKKLNNTIHRDLTTKSNKVYISASHQNENLNLFLDMVELINHQYSIINSPKFIDGFLDPNHLNLMELSDSAIFFLSSADCLNDENGKLNLKSNKLAELNIARAIFKSKIILAWIDSNPIPKGINNSFQYTIFYDSLDWKANLEIVKLMRELFG